MKQRRRRRKRPTGQELDGELLARLRKEQGWTQEKFAEESGVPAKTIQRAERGESISLRNIGLLADTLGYPAVRLLNNPTREPHRKVDSQETAEQPGGGTKPATVGSGSHDADAKPSEAPAKESSGHEHSGPDSREQEITQAKMILFSKQIDVFQRFVSAAYRTRNAARAIRDELAATGRPRINPELVDSLQRRP